MRSLCANTSTHNRSPFEWATFARADRGWRRRSGTVLPIIPRTVRALNKRAPEHMQALPAVGEILDNEKLQPWIAMHGRDAVRGWVRDSLDELRDQILAGNLAAE